MMLQLVSLENAYTKPGQAALVRLNGKELKAVPSCSPFSDEINAPVLYKLRGDIPAGTTKLPAYSLSVKANLELHVEEATTPELYNIAEGEERERESKTKKIHDHWSTHFSYDLWALYAAFAPKIK